MPGIDESTHPPITSDSDIPCREVQFARIYDKLEPNRPIDIMIFGDGKLIIDEENLGLERVSRESLMQAWMSQKDAWTIQCKELGINIDPFTVFTYYHIQKKAYEILGAPTNSKGKERNEKYAQGESVKLSEMRGMAMCSEYAALESYIAQKIGEQAHLIVGTTIVGEDQWREAHMYTWIDGINAVLEGTLAAENEYPALMRPVNNATLQTLENGLDIECKRIGTNQTAIYGLAAGGFGARLRPKLPNSLQEATRG